MLLDLYFLSCSFRSLEIRDESEPRYRIYLYLLSLAQKPRVAFFTLSVGLRLRWLYPLMMRGKALL